MSRQRPSNFNASEGTTQNNNAMKQTKRPARAKGMTQIYISMSKELMERIERAAAADNRNRSNFITKVLLAHLDAQGKAQS